MCNGNVTSWAMVTLHVRALSFVADRCSSPLAPSSVMMALATWSSHPINASCGTTHTSDITPPCRQSMLTSYSSPSAMIHTVVWTLLACCRLGVGGRTLPPLSQKVNKVARWLETCINTMHWPYYCYCCLIIKRIHDVQPWVWGDKAFMSVVTMPILKALGMEA